MSAEREDTKKDQELAREIFIRVASAHIGAGQSRLDEESAGTMADESFKAARVFNDKVSQRTPPPEVTGTRVLDQRDKKKGKAE
ncbi:TPA: hypothetical protein ACGCGV_000207 [Stenotrophomonas maltophilia]|uniref:hypothetical protein n=1 Tax=Stenotrophomonas maltophilia TaxID=40324 RepID=UPI00066C11A4|nr:hypothetical protein [Stenotrophomonas maltophilia]MBH1676132.1 hypothetical protein [Stenotrophomonas maltophilia]HEL3212196.1 hypothetical protein [Stenotrophomonas maltophilia]HEL3740221.1 hypothetical protein [Stenotrophomonas maltophilia]HEL3760449.1 hypothetical protein [Stenotrophomonas maltophilia]